MAQEIDHPRGDEEIALLEEFAIAFVERRRQVLCEYPPRRLEEPGDLIGETHRQVLRFDSPNYCTTPMLRLALRL
jgi:hypothetical protein